MGPMTRLFAICLHIDYNNKDRCSEELFVHLHIISPLRKVLVAYDMHFWTAIMF
jgi:hypothetical protein